jgi:hypothetical protein
MFVETVHPEPVDGQPLPDYKEIHLQELEVGLRYQAEIGRVAMNTFLHSDSQNLSPEERTNLANLPSTVYLRENSVLRFSAHNKIDITMPSFLLRAAHWGAGYSLPELAIYEQFGDTMRAADLLRYLELIRINGRLSRPFGETHHLHAGNSGLDMALMFYLTLGRVDDEAMLWQHYPAELTLVQNSPFLRRDVDGLTKMLAHDKEASEPKSTNLPPGWNTEAEDGTPAEDKHDCVLRGIAEPLPQAWFKLPSDHYNLITLPFIDLVEMGRPRQLMGQLQRVASKHDGAEVVISMRQENSNLDWLTQIKNFLALRDLAEERGWQHIYCSLPIIIDKSYALFSDDIGWQLTDGNGGSLLFSDEDMLAYLQKHQSNITTGFCMPLDYGCNAVFYAYIPPAETPHASKPLVVKRKRRPADFDYR